MTVTCCFYVEVSNYDATINNMTLVINTSYLTFLHVSHQRRVSGTSRWTTREEVPLHVNRLVLVPL